MSAKSSAVSKYSGIAISVSLKGYSVERSDLISAKFYVEISNYYVLVVLLKFNSDYGFWFVLPLVVSLKALWSIEKGVPSSL
jgi:hypothetical protein